MVVEQNQTLFDMAVQHCGDASPAMAIARLNDLSITENLRAGSSLILAEVIEPGMVQYFIDENVVPGTGLIKAVQQGQLSGIGYMSVGVNFIVS